MDECDSIPFSSLLAGMLLLKREVSYAEVVNMISDLANEGIYFDDDNDNIDCLVPFLASYGKASFRLRDDLFYNAKMPDGVRVKDFLFRCTNEKVRELLKLDEKSLGVSLDYCNEENIVNKIDSTKRRYLKKGKFLSFLF